jgi:uncharacterized repeat protein (TIGR01451 family)
LGYIGLRQTLLFPVARLRVALAFVVVTFLATMNPQIARAQTTQYSDVPATGIAFNETSAPCATPLTRTFNVTTNFIVSDVNLGVLYSHTYRGDNIITLRGPNNVSVQVVNQVGAGAQNYNATVDDEAASGVANYTANENNLTAPPYANSYRPTNPLSALDGQNAFGTWTLQICDNGNADSGTYTRADLFLSQAGPQADLSLTQTVSNATPANGTAINYTLVVTNASASTLAANGVAVRDILPAGVTFVGSTATQGSYASGTGLWTVGSLAPGATATLTINATVNASSGATVGNAAEVWTSSANDNDSTPGNSVTTEDDYANVNFTVTGTRTAGTPPTLVCPVGSQLFDWGSTSPVYTWTTGALNNRPGGYALNTVGTFFVDITTSTAFVTGSPTINSNLTGGLTGEPSLFLNMNNNALSDVATTIITMPGAVPGAQFRLFDVDFGSGSYADKVTVTGTFNGVPVTPVITNGVSNYVAGNVAIGDAGASDTTADGNVTVTFTSAVDTITVVYGNHTTAPANPGNQWMSIHDISFCRPQTALALTKVTGVYDDSVNPAFAIPGNDVTYTIGLSNSGTGSVTADTVFIVDPLPATLTFFNGDANGPLAGTDPVLFTDNGSNLTFSYGTDVRYAQTAPANFAACNYTPAAGYDPLVRFICVNPKGRMTGKSGALTPGFTVTFRAKIN